MKLNIFLKKLKDIEKKYGSNISVVMADDIPVVKPVCLEYRGNKKVIITDEN
ncbi:MAG TPA: hypothetical protein VJB41_02790 [Patescibacteria group bacterium]|nr:hypothetical protein [Patescibacteria group bacterium]